MAISISLSLSSASRAAMTGLAGSSARMRDAILKALDRENQYTVGAIVSERLSQRGPETLGVISGRLRSSLRANKASFDGSNIMSTIGSNVVYFGVHEFGINEQVYVRTHSRTISKIFGKKVGPRETTVREHTRHMRFPARAPIYRTLQERAPLYGRAIGIAVANTMKS